MQMGSETVGVFSKEKISKERTCVYISYVCFIINANKFLMKLEANSFVFMNETTQDKTLCI